MPDSSDDKLLIRDAGRNRADAIRNRQLLLDTAGRLFAEYGVESVSMSQLAQAAGVGKGTLYRNFTNKTEICYALLDQDQRDLQTQTLRRLGEYPAEPLENLRWFLEAAAHFVIRNREMLVAGVEAGNVSSLQFDAHLWWRQTIRGLLARLNPLGDLDYMTDVLYVMLDINTIHFQQTFLGYPAERIIAGLNRTLDRLLRVP
jgi:AcrR family transcriptional regulator